MGEAFALHQSTESDLLNWNKSFSGISWNCWKLLGENTLSRGLSENSTQEKYSTLKIKRKFDNNDMYMNNQDFGQLQSVLNVFWIESRAGLGGNKKNRL